MCNAAAMTMLGSYLTAYSIRIHIFNYYKNTGKKYASYDTKGFGFRVKDSLITPRPCGRKEYCPAYRSVSPPSSRSSCSCSRAAPRHSRAWSTA
ncbi:MAG: hypothetical protein RDU13_04515 [Elusimicrobiales bacterium]|nr:hypothetical protein [Elusimicrobiales bacterium]